MQGQVSYNDGEFIEVEIVGIEGIEKDLFLDTVQFHRCDTSDTPDDFQNRFPVGAQLGIETITKITPLTPPESITGEYELRHRANRESME